MTKRMLIMLVFVGVIIGGVLWFNHFKASMIKQALAANAVAPATVSTMEATLKPWQPSIASVGSLRAAKGIDVTAEVPGTVSHVKFASGQVVKQGEVLVQLDAEADTAKLRALKATAKLAAITYERDQRQYKAKAVSKSVIDADVADLENKRAQVAEQSAMVDKKTIRAPFAGRLGISTINEGRYLSAGESFVTLQRLDPIFVDFWLPQKDLAKILVGQKVTLTVDAFDKHEFVGELTAISPKVDATTRNVRVEAKVPNGDRKLVPGMFGHVSIDIGGTQDYLTVPQTAITYNPYGSSVFVVASGKTGDGPVAHQVFVTTGATRGDQVAVVSGIKAGDTIVTSGQLKLRNGTPLVINNTVQPANDPAPTPREDAAATEPDGALATGTAAAQAG